MKRHSWRGSAEALVTLLQLKTNYNNSYESYITEWFAGDNIVGRRIAFHQAGLSQTKCPSHGVRWPTTFLLNRELGTRRQRLVVAKKEFNKTNGY